MTTTNREVARAWSEGRSAESHTGSFSTDGVRIWSYALLIGETLNGEKVVKDYRSPNFVSATTSKHVSLAARYADAII
jgi:hypothetical protein